MTAELSPDDLAAMRQRHAPNIGGTFCLRCDGNVTDPKWPCDARRLLDEVERLRGDMQDAAAKHVCACTVLTYPEWQSEAPSVSEGGKE